MILIAESGATKCDWAILNVRDGSSRVFQTGGLNAAVSGEQDIERVLSDVCSRLRDDDVEAIHFYGAGIVGSATADILETKFRELFSPGIEVELSSDLMAAARALYADGAGLVGIMGTGSNCALYDGHTCSQKVYSGGFILGDEGSGARLGKLFLADYLKNKVPETVAKLFRDSFPDLDYNTIVRRVYRDSAPSRFLASLSAAIVPWSDSSDYLAAMVRRNTEDYFDAFLSHYDTASFPIGFVGTMAVMTEGIIRETAARRGVTVSRIIKSPITELIAYYV